MFFDVNGRSSAPNPHALCPFLQNVRKSAGIMGFGADDRPFLENFQKWAVHSPNPNFPHHFLGIFGNGQSWSSSPMRPAPLWPIHINGRSSAPNPRAPWQFQGNSKKLVEVIGLGMEERPLLQNFQKWAAVGPQPQFSPPTSENSRKWAVLAPTPHSSCPFQERCRKWAGVSSQPCAHFWKMFGNWQDRGVRGGRPPVS